MNLLGLGVAVPDTSRAQPEIAETLVDVWRLRGRDAERVRRIARESGIDERCTVMPLEQVAPLSTRRRMEAYDRHAPPLAAEAAATALSSSRMAADAITDLVVVSCTGFSAPGLDVALVERLGLRRDVRRTVVGFMGCFGALVGLRTARAACTASANARVLVVSTELCSLHLPPEGGRTGQVTASLFADGAAAAVVASRPLVEPIAMIGRAGSRLVTEGRDWMTWRITDAGFAMTLSRCVPDAVRSHVAEFAATVSPRAETYVVHPGGRDILDAVEAALELEDDRGLPAARAVLRRYGNMSSATVLFVLEEARRRGDPLPALMLAFGPGLALEGLALEPVRPRRRRGEFGKLVFQVGRPMKAVPRSR